MGGPLFIIQHHTFQQYHTSLFREFLMLEAKSLLKSTGKTVKEIAYGLGFPDASTFGKFFRKYEGLTPRQYRDIY